MAFGGVQIGVAKQALAATAAGIMNGVGDTPSCSAAAQAIGATRMAVAELLINVDSDEVTIYTPAIAAMGPKSRRFSTSVVAIHAEIPVFDKAVDMGIIAAISTILSQPIFL